MFIDGPVVHLQSRVAPVPGEPHHVVLPIIHCCAALLHTDVYCANVERHTNFTLLLKHKNILLHKPTGRGAILSLPYHLFVWVWFGHDTHYVQHEVVAEAGSTVDPHQDAFFQGCAEANGESVCPGAWTLIRRPVKSNETPSFSKDVGGTSWEQLQTFTKSATGSS